MTAVVAALGAVGILAVAFALWSLRTQARYRRVVGAETWRACGAVTRAIGRRATRVRTVTGGKWLLAIGGAWLIFRIFIRETSVEWLPVSFGMFAVAIILWTAQRDPALILVLGASTAEQLALQARLRDAVFPFRPVSLLQTGQIDVDRKIAGDCYRIDDENDWRQAVFDFCRALPLIVLDVRRMTPFVELEIEHIVGAQYLHKTLFIASPAEEDRLDAAGCRLDARTCVADDDRAVQFVRYLLLEKERVPASTAGSRLGDLMGEWEAGQPRRQAGPDAESVRTSVRVDGLAPFSFIAPAGWEQTSCATNGSIYQVTFRPPEEFGVRNPFKLKARLDVTVSPADPSVVVDEAALRRGTADKIAQLQAGVTREYFGRRSGVMSHECFYQRGIAAGYLAWFVAAGDAFAIHWSSLNRERFGIRQPDVEQFIESIGIERGESGA